MAGKRIILPSGKYGIGSGGKAAITDASGECPGCGCGGAPNTCDSCGNCCFSDQSTATITWPAFDMPCTVDGAVIAIQGGGTKSGIPYVGGGMWALQDPLGGDEDQSVYYEVRCVDGQFLVTVTTTGLTAEGGMGIRSYDILNEVPTDFGCCGGTRTVHSYWTCTNENPPGGSTDDDGDKEWTISFSNNKCCRCDVDATPTCVVSTHDYADDCDESDENTCNQFTGDEAFCDDAPA